MGEQLHLDIDTADETPSLPHRLRAMQPTPRAGPFDDPDYFFEPWWPGARAVLFLERGRLQMQTEHLGDPLDAFPELRVIQQQIRGDGIVIEGTLLVLDTLGRPDGELLRRRFASGDRDSGHGAFIASDLLYASARSVAARPFGERRDRLGVVLRDDDWCVLSRGLVGEGASLARAAASMGLSEISARRLDASYRAGPAGDDWYRIPVTEQPAVETRPLLTLLQRLPL